MQVGDAQAPGCEQASSEGLTHASPAHDLQSNHGPTVLPRCLASRSIDGGIESGLRTRLAEAADGFDEDERRGQAASGDEGRARADGAVHLTRDERPGGLPGASSADPHRDDPAPLVGGCGTGDHVLQGGDGNPLAEAVHQGADDEERQRRRHTDHNEADGEQCGREDDEADRPEPGPQPPDVDCCERRRECRCRDHQAAGPCVEAELLLEVHGQRCEEEPEDEEEDHEADADRPDHRRLPCDQPQPTRLLAHGHDRASRPPTRQASPHPRRGDEADGVRRERQAPATQLSECSSHRWEHGQRHRQHGGVLSHAAGALEAAPVVADQHDREVDEARGPDALQEPADEQGLEGRCGGRQHAEGGEGAQARHQHCATPEAVGQHADGGRHDDAGQSPGGHEHAGPGSWLVEGVEDVGDRRPDQRVGQDAGDGDREDEAQRRVGRRRDPVGRL